MNNKVGIYRSITEAEPTTVCEVNEVYDLIRNGSFKPETEHVIELEKCHMEGKAEKARVDDAKKALLKAVSFSGSFPRSAGYFVEDTALCTGLINLDIDDDNDPDSLQQFKSRLSEIPWIEACWLSATGKLTGYLSVNARIELLDSLDSYPLKIRECLNGRYDLNKLYGLYHQAINSELTKCGVQASDKAKDVKRLRFLSHDDGIYVNYKCTSFTVAMLEEHLSELVTKEATKKDSRFKDFYSSPKELKEGERNSTLFGVGRYLSGKSSISNEDIKKEITRINAEYCKPTLEKIELATLIKSVLKKRKDDDTSKLDFPLTELGNAERLVSRLGGKIRFCTDYQKWYIYNGKRWEKDEQGRIIQLAEDTVRALVKSTASIENDDVAEAVQKHARTSESLNKLKAMIELASTQPGIPIQSSAFDSQEYLINLGNGTLDLRTKNLHPHEPNDLISRLIPIDYEPSSKGELWEKTLSLVLDQETIGFIQRLFGYCLTASIKEQKMFIFYGTGANGKTTILRTITNIMNEYSSQSSINTFLEKKNDGILNDLARLQYKRLTLIPEYDESKRLSEALIKNATGGDSISCRFLYCEPIEFVPKFKIIMATNHKPLIAGSDIGIKRRVVFIPFVYTIPVDQQNSDLLEELQREFPAILNWIVEGAYQWYQHGLGIPQYVVDETKDYLAENDMIDRFLRDVCLLSEADSTQSSVLFEHFKMWAELNGEPDLSQKAFSQKLMEKGYARIEKNHRMFFACVSVNPFSEVASKVQKQKDRERADEVRKVTA